MPVPRIEVKAKKAAPTSNRISSPKPVSKIEKDKLIVNQQHTHPHSKPKQYEYACQIETLEVGYCKVLYCEVLSTSSDVV